MMMTGVVGGFGQMTNKLNEGEKKDSRISNTLTDNGRRDTPFAVAYKYEYRVH